MPDRPLVSIIILSYNNQAFIDKCLLCTIGQDYRPVEVIVVDQGSTDGTSELVRHQFPHVRLIENDRNTGFADGTNRGICASTGEYLLLLNSDLFLAPTFVGQAVEQFRSSSEDRLGMLASIVYQYRAGECTTEIDCLGFLLLPYNVVVTSENMYSQEWVLGPAGSAMFLRRTMLEDVRLPTGDYLDSTYFCYGEDVELALRAQLLGWRCLYAPIVAGWHIGAASVNIRHRYNEKPLPLLIHVFKNRYLTLLTCYPLCLLLWTLPWTLLTECGQMAAYALAGRSDLLKCLFGAYRSVFSMLPAVFAKRRWLQGRRRVSCTYLRSLYAKWSFLRTLRSLIQKV